MRKIFIIYIFLLGVFSCLQAQEIKGKVFEKETSDPLIGVTVAIENSTAGTITDMDGAYSIRAKQGDVLIFSYLGMITQKIAVQNERVIDVYLSSDANVLDELVVVGYGKMRRKDLTGAISSIKGEDIQATTSGNVLGGLAGKLPGVQVVQNSGTPGGDVTVRIRGIGTINNADPLYVVDGMPVNSGIWFLNPNDIQSIDVLKDASATAIYGSRGANGVVMVTTKNGTKGKTQVSVDYSLGFQNVAKKYDLMNASQYASLHNDMRKNGGYDLNPDFANPESLGNGTDWLDEIFRTAPIHKLTATISGGNETVHSTSIGYYKQDGILMNTGYERVTLQSNIRSEVSPKFRFTSNIALSGEKRDNHDAYTVIANAMRILPTIPVYNENGDFAGPEGRADLNGNAMNPVGILKKENNTVDAYRGIANVSGEYDITDYLQIKTVLGAEAGYNYNNVFMPKYKWGNVEQTETKQDNSSSYEILTIWDNTLTFNKKFDKHLVTALVGTSFQNYTKKWMGAAGVGRASDHTTELDNALEATGVSGNRLEWSVMSYLGRINYSYDDKYFFTASLRADGSSRFGSQNRYGYFPSFSGAWTISNEDFMKGNGVFDFLKLRAGYGHTGNQLIDNYIYTERLDAKGQYNFGSSATSSSTTVGTIYPYRLSNPKIRWESVEQYNAGVDMSFLNNRISVTADFYLKNTRDMLTRVPVPQTSGYSLITTDNPYINVGKVRNTGMEFSVNTINFDSDNFKWNTGFNIAFNKNKVLKLGEGGDIFEYLHLIRENEAINVFYGYKMDHIYQNLDDVFTGPSMGNRAPNRESHDPTKYTSPGDIAFKKYTDGDVVSEQDRVIIGSPHPKFTAGLSNNISYKNIDFSFFLQGVYGNKIWNEIRREQESMSTTYNQLKSTLNRWNGEGSSYSMPRAIYADPNDNNRRSDRYVEDGSFLKLKNVNLGYRLPSKWIKPLSLQAVKIYANIDNLFTITDYSGLDPEVGVNGYDYVIYPPARTFMFGINVNF